jgi:hypothetical protein
MAVHEQILNKEIGTTLAARASVNISTVGAGGLARESSVLKFMVKLFH